MKAYQTLLHELGHALGLKHPFSITFANSLVLPAALQTTKYTVMAYGDLPGAYDSATGRFTEQQANFLPTTPMLLDIAAMQSLYGANMSYHAGNDVYVFNQGQTYYQTIWDAGGTDTIQWNGSNGVEIDLRAGEFSQLGNPITFSGASPQLDTVAIAYGVTIENALGGSGNDTLIGNDAANDLEGGAGNDILYGGIGDDKFDSNAAYRSGNDVFYGGTGNDAFFLDSAGDSVIEYAGEGIDTIWVSFSYSLLNLPNIENLRAFGSNGVSLQGNSLENAFSGTGGNDSVDGGPGFDEFDFIGNIATYTIVGHGNVIVSGIEGVDTLTGIEKLVFSDGFQLLQNNPAVVAASNATVRPNQSVLMPSLMSATDADGDAITQYR
ncbi:MAG: M10 family metallopeptidase C-terminal domain-containing protein, partial [Betaproteobacteria bacterium]